MLCVARQRYEAQNIDNIMDAQHHMTVEAAEV